MVSIGEAKQQLQSQQRQVASQIKKIETTRLPTPTRRALARATPQTQAKYKAELPKRQAALEQAKKEAIADIQEFERTELGGYKKEIQTAESKQKELETIARKKAEKEKEKYEQKKGSYEEQQRQLGTGELQLVDPLARYREWTKGRQITSVSDSLGTWYIDTKTKEKIYMSNPELQAISGGQKILVRPGSSQQAQVQVSEFKQQLPSTFQFPVSDFEKSMGRTFQGVPLVSTLQGVRPAWEVIPTKIEPKITQKIKSYIQERVSVGPSGIKIDLLSEKEAVKLMAKYEPPQQWETTKKVVSKIPGTKKIEEFEKVSRARGEGTLETLGKGVYKDVSTSLSETTMGSLEYLKKEPIVIGIGKGTEKVKTWIESKEVKPPFRLPSIAELHGEPEYISPEKRKITTKDIQQIPFIGTIEKQYQKEVEWGKTTGQDIIKQEKLLESKSKELEKAETFEEQEKILNELREGGIQVILKTDISTGEQYYDFKTTQAPDLVYKGFREETPTRTGFFLSALGKGYGEVGTALAETKLKGVSPWEKSFQERKGEVYEYSPISKIVGKGAEMLGASQLYFVPGVGTAAFVAPFVEKGLESPFALKSYVKAHPYETAFAVGSVGLTIAKPLLRYAREPLYIGPTGKATRQRQWLIKPKALPGRVKELQIPIITPSGEKRLFTYFQAQTYSPGAYAKQARWETWLNKIPDIKYYKPRVKVTQPLGGWAIGDTYSAIKTVGKKPTQAVWVEISGKAKQLNVPETLKEFNKLSKAHKKALQNYVEQTITSGRKVKAENVYKMLKKEEGLYKGFVTTEQLAKVTPKEGIIKLTTRKYLTYDDYISSMKEIKLPEGAQFRYFKTKATGVRGPPLYGDVIVTRPVRVGVTDDAIKMFGPGERSKKGISLFKDIYGEPQKVITKMKIPSPIKTPKPSMVTKTKFTPPKPRPPTPKIDSSIMAPRMVGGEGRGVSEWYGVGREGIEDVVTYTTKTAGGALITTTKIPQMKINGIIKSSFVPSEREELITRVETISKADIISKTGFISRAETILKPEQVYKTLTIPRTIQIPRTTQIPKTIQVQKIVQVQKTIQIPKTVQIPKSIPIPTTPTKPRPPKIPKPIIPFFIPKGETVRRKRLPRRPIPKREVYIPEVRRRGKWVAIGKFRTAKRAEAVGKRRALRTAAASVRLRKDGKIVSLKPSGLFRAAKREKGILVQRKTRRIVSAGEKREISYIGSLAAKAKRVKSKSKKRVKR